MKAGKLLVHWTLRKRSLAADSQMISTSRSSGAVAGGVSSANGGGTWWAPTTTGDEPPNCWDETGGTEAVVWC